ncbi:MAG TPA: hypothetical protein VMU48_17925 [Terracidiphilus sp.]|nr:hypothetical protein [Terracidiphilus sp.]
MEDAKNAATDQAKIDKVTVDRAKIQELTTSTDEVKAQANKELRRSLELRASFHEKLAALSAGSIAVAVSVGVALLGKATPHSAFLHSNLDWLVVIAFFLWLSLVCAIGHNAVFIKIARLEAERAEEWSKWIGLINASTMQSVTGSGGSQVAQILVDHIGNTLHNRIQKSAMNQHRTEQSILRATVLGAVGIGSFLIAYTIVFISVIRIWWITR